MIDNSRYIPLEDGEAEINVHGTTIIRPWPRAEDKGPGAYLTPYDLAELLRIACKTDAEVLRVLSRNMTAGHRFRMIDEDGELVFPRHADDLVYDSEDAF